MVHYTHLQEVREETDKQRQTDRHSDRAREPNSPASFGDDHLTGAVMEATPQVEVGQLDGGSRTGGQEAGAVQVHPGVVTRVDAGRRTATLSREYLAAILHVTPVIGRQKVP